MTILKVDTVSGIGTEGTVFDGDITFDSLNYMTLPKGTTTQSNRGRAVFGGGWTSAPTNVNTMDYVEIQSMGTAVDFGDLTQVEGWAGASGAASATYNATIQYLQIQSQGNTIDFGDLTVGRSEMGNSASSTRGVFAGGLQSGGSNNNTCDYVEIATQGNACDFGDTVAAGGTSGWSASNGHGGL